MIRLPEDDSPARVPRDHPCYTAEHLTSLKGDRTTPEKG
jgi:hypothetical protein